ncbi:MAG: hypothetical protein KID00_16560 [Clostridium argentinense]|nr:hypothetical protein [Clostridium argentinense]
MKKRIGMLALIGLLAINTLYTTVFTQELKITNNSITTYSQADPKPW